MPGRTYAAGNFQLLLNGANCGFLKSIEGGAVVGEIIAEKTEETLHFTRKRLGGVTYSPFVVQLGMGKGKELYDWISASWNGSYVRKNGAVVAADTQFVAVSQREFVNALLVETTIPAADGASKDAAYLTLRLAPELTRTTKASDRLDPPGPDRKAWRASNFRVSIDGLDCKRVTAVESFTVKVSMSTDDVGDHRRVQKQAGRVEFPNLKITMAEASADGWFDWFEDFVVKGNNDDSKEKNGSLSFLSADMASDLLRIDFFNLGIFRIEADKAEAGSERVATVSAHLYCERMEFHAG